MADKFIIGANEGKFQIAYDGDADGQNSVELKVDLDEVAQEIFKKGEALEGQAMVDYKFDLTGKLRLTLDTDKDGEPSVELVVNVGEALKEANILGK